jgi:hypothetical protein
VPVFDPYDLEFRRDPYPVYRCLRSEDPVHWTEAGAWVISRYRDCSFVLTDLRFGVEAPAEVREARRALSPPSLAVLGETMLFRDPPDHTRLRGLVSTAFTPRAVEAMRPLVEGIVEELVSAVDGRGEMDVITDFAHPLPVRVICEMLDVPPSDRDAVREWSRDLAGVVDIPIDDETVRRGALAAESLIGYFRELLAVRRRRAGSDLLSALVGAEASLTESELLAVCVQLLFGGHETTQNLIGNGMLALLTHRDQLDRLRDDRGLLRTAVEEFLRYDGPGQIAGRWARHDVAIDGHTIEAGGQVLVLLGSANRDPEEFHEPDALDVARTPNRHLTFGGGLHFCLGAPLARLEGRIAIGALVERFPELQLATEAPEWKPTFALRGLARLPVVF